MIKEKEGVIKFALQFTPAPPLAEEELREIGAWREILRRLRMIGQDPGRYGGLGFGNLSRRLPPYDAPEKERRFVITGTQTGGLEQMGGEGYAVVREYDPEANRVVAEGPVRPSAEALTHGTFYDMDPGVRWVMHVHSPEIWSRSAELGIPVTSPGAAYGSPELAGEIRRVLADPGCYAGRIISISGHEDGVFTFGASAQEAGMALLRYLTSALEEGASKGLK